LSDAGWWQTPLWQYAVFAVVTYSRAAAERLAVPVEEIVRRIAVEQDLQLHPVTSCGHSEGRTRAATWPYGAASVTNP
jgi:hypothetical protein